jgi:G:T-mismatch repair DNA endonuclease (very short patch repair protein)
MKQKIIDLINTRPKQYARMVKNDLELANWVMTNTKTSSEDWPAKIYSAVHAVSDVCQYGQQKHFDRISTGFIGCGPASTCRCTAEKIGNKVSETKKSITSERKELTNKQRSQTMLEKYGVAYNSQRSDIKHIWTKAKISDSAVAKLTDIAWMTENYITKERTLVDIADELGVYYSTVAEYCKILGFKIRQTSNYSLTERQISDWLSELGITHVKHDWELLKNREVDIFLPEHNLAIEVNGLYWHSWNPNVGKPEIKRRHVSKTLELKESGVHLIHITDYEWNNSNSIIKNIILSKLKKTKRIYARNCKIKILSVAEQRDFLNRNHLQGYIKSNFAVGLFFDDELVQLASFGKSRFNKNYQTELLRFCSESTLTVVGGLSKLMSYAKKQVSGAIITYCDASKSQAQGYIKAGFVLQHLTDPGYFWTDGAGVISRYKCQKQNLKKWLSTYDPETSESENMFAAGYRRYWDCGNYVLIY